MKLTITVTLFYLSSMCVHSFLNITCPPGYQAFHTFHGPLEEAKYPAVDCIQDVAYCCVSEASTAGTCQKKITYKTGNKSSVRITSIFPNMDNPITRSVDIKRHSGANNFEYVFEVCNTLYVNSTVEEKCASTGSTVRYCHTGNRGEACTVTVPAEDVTNIFESDVASKCSRNKCTFASGDIIKTLAGSSGVNKCNDDTVRIVYNHGKSCIFYETEGDGDNDEAIKGIIQKLRGFN